MAKKRSQKENEVERLHRELLRVSSLVLSSFHGLTVVQANELRRLVQACGGKYRVLKNTLAERAAKGTPAESLLAGLTGVNSIAYTEGDPVSLARALTKYAKDNPTITFRAGLVEGRVLSLNEVQALGTLPTREELFSRLLYLLQAPAQCLAAATNGVRRNLVLVVKQGHAEKKFAEVS